MSLPVYEALKTRQKNMQIPYEVIAKKANIGTATVKRFFIGGNTSIETVERIAMVLGCDINITNTNSAQDLLNEQIEKKALQIVNRVMKTSALELQKPNMQAYEQMMQKAKEQISKMPRSQIWS